MMTRVVFSVLGSLAAGVLAGVAFAAPPEGTPFPELEEKKKPRRESSALEKAALKAAGSVRTGKPVGPAPDAVEFLLFLYREGGDRKDLDWATMKAREMAKQGLGRGAVAALYRIAQAGGLTLVEADDAYRRRQEELAGITAISTELYAQVVLDAFARAALLDSRDAVADALLTTGSFWQMRTRKEGNALRVLEEGGQPAGLSGHAAALRVGIEAAALSGSPPVREETRLLAHEILAKFWDDRSGQFLDRKEGRTENRIAGARAALHVWETGIVCGDQLLVGRGRRALESGLADALGDPVASPSAGLAAGRMARHPVQMALVGEAADPALVALRQAAYAVFEPSKLMLNLDPLGDAARFAELLYPPELAPALFICVETVCSPPVTKAEGLKEQVAEIRKLAAEAER